MIRREVGSDIALSDMSHVVLCEKKRTFDIRWIPLGATSGVVLVGFVKSIVDSICIMQGTCSHGWFFSHTNWMRFWLKNTKWLTALNENNEINSAINFIFNNLNKFIFLQLICDIVVFIQQILHTLVNNGIEFRKRTKFYDYNPMVGFKASEIHHFF